MRTPESTATRAAILASLTTHGWKSESLHSAVAEKYFDTVVGPKQALAWCFPINSGTALRMTGEYWSEGRNVLSTCMIDLPVDAEQAAIARAVERWVAMAAKGVSQSYAASLLRSCAA